MILDIYDDPRKLVYNSIASEKELPLMVKTANFEIGEQGRSGKRTFALPELKRFPMDTMEDVWVSYEYLNKTAHNLKPRAAERARKNLEKTARWMGIKLGMEKSQKQASVEYEIAIKDFAVAIKKEVLPEAFAKSASQHIYNDHLVLYPLDTDENIDKCNKLFPKGLDGNLEVFRAKVASAIATKLPKERLTRNVVNYLAIPKSAAISDLEMRRFKFPEIRRKFAGQYNELMNILNQKEVNHIEYGLKLESLDKQANIGLENYDRTLIAPKRFLQPIVNDIEPNHRHIEWNGEKTAFANFQKNQDILKSVFPGIENHLDTPDSIEQFFKTAHEAEVNYIIKLARSKDKIKGGKADNKPDSKFDPEQLAEGIEHELEHTEDIDTAKEIAKDHLMEDENYYEMLEEMEEKLDKKKNKKD